MRDWQFELGLVLEEGLGLVRSFWKVARVSVWSLMRSSSFLSFWVVTALTSSTVVSKTRLAVSLATGLVVSMLLVMTKPTACAESLHVVVLENSLMIKNGIWLKSGHPWFGFPIVDGRVKGASALDGCFEKGKATLWIHRGADLLELLFNFVVAFKLGGRILGWIPYAVHRADEFLDINAISHHC